MRGTGIEYITCGDDQWSEGRFQLPGPDDQRLVPKRHALLDEIASGRQYDHGPDGMKLRIRIEQSSQLEAYRAKRTENYRRAFDDPARALLLTALLEELGELPADEIEDLTTRYLAFLAYALENDTGRFRNFLAYEPRRWIEEIGSEDCHGRALVGLGALVGRTNRPGLRGVAVSLFGAALPATLELTSPHALAYTLLGIHDYLRWLSGDCAAEEAAQQIASRLVTLFHETQQEGWTWFEDSLTYANACLPQAMLVAGESLGQDQSLEIGLATLDWLMSVQCAEGGHFVPVGSNGFYPRGGRRACFDQQPIEASVSVSACLTAQRITGDSGWQREAERAFEWFLGRNDLGLPLCDLRTGACHDCLCPDQVNANQGAESTLAYLVALAEMRLADQTSILSCDADTTASALPVDQEREKEIV